MAHLYELHNLEVSVVGDPETFVCAHEPGLAFKVIGENLVFQGSALFSMYVLATILPYLPAKQRPTDKNDWMTTDERIACPDPHCGAEFQIQRHGTITQSHEETTRVPLRKSED